MGTFLSLTSIVGKTKNDVVNSLKKYTQSVEGGLTEEPLTVNDGNCCVVEERNGNTTVFNPFGYFEWDESAEFISRDLNATVFSFHIHDGDFWMYILFSNGEIIDQFNPIPDYWDENINKEERQSWKGNALTIAKHLPYIKPESIEKYLIRWDLESDRTEKAYLDDEFVNEDWQLLDFMKKLNLPYPLSDKEEVKGQTYKLWTKSFPLKKNRAQESKTWWKFW